jgi:hypothetical protein
MRAVEDTSILPLSEWKYGNKEHGWEDFIRGCDAGKVALEPAGG